MENEEISRIRLSEREERNLSKKYISDFFVDYGISIIFWGSLIIASYPLIRDLKNYKPEKQYEGKIIQIKSFEDKDNIQGYESIILEDSRTFKIEERNGKLSLLESSLEKIK